MTITVEAATYTDRDELTQEHGESRLLRAALLKLVTAAERLDERGLERTADLALDG